MGKLYKVVNTNRKVLRQAMIYTKNGKHAYYFGFDYRRFDRFVRGARDWCFINGLLNFEKISIFKDIFLKDFKKFLETKCNYDHQTVVFIGAHDYDYLDTLMELREEIIKYNVIIYCGVSKERRLF